MYEALGILKNGKMDREIMVHEMMSVETDYSFMDIPKLTDECITTVSK